MARSKLRLSRNQVAQSLQRIIRSNAEQWNRIKEANGESDVSLNQLVIEFTIDVLGQPEWAGTEAEIKVAGVSLFAAQALARDLTANRHKQEVQEIRPVIPEFVPDLGHVRGRNPHE